MTMSIHGSIQSANNHRLNCVVMNVYNRSTVFAHRSFDIRPEHESRTLHECHHIQNVEPFVSRN